MTKEEIKALVDATIRNQGNQVDAGGKLADILNALADGMGGGGERTAPKVLNITRTDSEPHYDAMENSKEELAEYIYDDLSITKEEALDLLNGKYDTIEINQFGYHIPAILAWAKQDGSVLYCGTLVSSDRNGVVSSVGVYFDEEYNQWSMYYSLIIVPSE